MNLPRILADPQQLTQILFNLVNNSIQAIGERGGKVTVRANVNGGGRLAIDVIDTGSGISPGQLRRLFTPYDTTKSEGTGTGLGLFLVKIMVEENGGTISAQSQVGGGTTFTVEFPGAPLNPVDGI